MAQHLTPQQQPRGIDSVQNGLLLTSGLHALWDTWAMSINPVNSHLSSLLTRSQNTMQITFFWSDSFFQQYCDRRLIQFNSTPDLPAPPREFIYEHFKQAVLANMRGAGQPANFDFDPTEDAQNMSVFQSGEGKEWFETVLADRLSLPDGERQGIDC